jgi:hypothetical protein
MTRFWRRTFQAIGALTAFIASGFRGSDIGFILGCLGLGVYFGVALVTGYSFICVKYRGEVELSREGTPVQFWLLVGAGFIALFYLVFERYRHVFAT